MIYIYIEKLIFVLFKLFCCHNFDYIYYIYYMSPYFLVSMCSFNSNCQTISYHQLMTKRMIFFVFRQNQIFVLHRDFFVYLCLLFLFFFLFVLMKIVLFVYFISFFLLHRRSLIYSQFVKILTQVSDHRFC